MPTGAADVCSQEEVIGAVRMTGLSAMRIPGHSPNGWMTH
jgi:hypothetical protein